MPGVQIDAVRFLNKVDRQVKLTIESSFKSEGKGLRTLTHKFDAALKRKVMFQAFAVAPIAGKIIADHYKDSIDIVTQVIGQGIKIGDKIYGHVYADFEPFSEAYAERKQKYYPQTADLYWKRGGNDWRKGGSDPERLEVVLRRAAGGWKGAVTRKKQYAKLMKSFLAGGKKHFIIRIGVELPPINRKGGVADSVFRRAFLGIDIDTNSKKLQTIYANATLDPHLIALDRLEANESFGHKPRPFIAQLMAERGSEAKAMVAARIRQIHS